MNTDLTKILKKEHEEKWVALTQSHDRVIDYADKLADLTKRVGDGQGNVIYMKVPRADVEYAFTQR